MSSVDLLDALYGAPLEEFTARRDAAAKAAKAAGDAALAARLKAAKKPSATAWACNAVVRAEPDALAALLEAGHALRLAHARMVQHGQAPDLREAMEAARAAEEPLVAAARRALEAAGHAATLEQLRRVRETLHAAAVGSDALREDLRAGRLVRDLEMPSLLEIAAGLPEAPPVSPVAERALRAEAEERERERREREEAERRAAIAEADRRVRDREQVLAETEAAVARARDALEEARAARRRLGD